jgi:hypothetical protein
MPASEDSTDTMPVEEQQPSDLEEKESENDPESDRGLIDELLDIYFR